MGYFLGKVYLVFKDCLYWYMEKSMIFLKNLVGGGKEIFFMGEGI